MLGPVVLILRSSVDRIREQFAVGNDASLCKDAFGVTMAEIEAIVEPDSMRDDIWWKSVEFICAHRPILPISSR